MKNFDVVDCRLGVRKTAGGAGVDAPGEYDMTLLQWAAWHGNAEREVLRYHPNSN
jgi:hypothetical protein